MFDEDRLERLISAHFDGELKAEERAELETMLLSTSKARQIFLDHADFHGLLRNQALQRLHGRGPIVRKGFLYLLRGLLPGLWSNVIHRVSSITLCIGNNPSISAFTSH